METIGTTASAAPIFIKLTPLFSTGLNSLPR
jgi:hypothetical protein